MKVRNANAPDSIPADMLAALHHYQTKCEDIVSAFRSGLEKQSPPKTLYHYTTGVGLRGILQSGVIWLTDIFALNDPSELRHSVNHAEALLHLEARTGHPAATVFAKRFAEIMMDAPSAVAHFFVASFSENGDDLGQWRAYGDDGRGIALGFDRELLEQAFVMPHGHIIESNSTFPMTYDDALCKRICTGLIKEAIPLIAMPHGRHLQNDTINEFMKNLSMQLGLAVLQTALYFKHEAYNDEREYRFMQIRAIKARLDDLKFRVGKASKIRYAEFPWARLGPTALQKVVIGPTADLTAATALIGDLLSGAGVNPGNVEIIGSQIPYRS
jgi:hypothetical protein